MKNCFICAGIAFALASCAPQYVQSPAANMSPGQMRLLTHKQLCELRENYPFEPQTETEIGRRNINCDPAYNECRAQGNKDNSPALVACINQLHANWKLQQELQNQKEELDRQKAQNASGGTLEAVTQSILNRQNTRRSRQLVRMPNGTIIQRSDEW